MNPSKCYCYKFVYLQVRKSTRVSFMLSVFQRCETRASLIDSPIHLDHYWFALYRDQFFCVLPETLSVLLEQSNATRFFSEGSLYLSETLISETKLESV